MPVQAYSTARVFETYISRVVYWGPVGTTPIREKNTTPVEMHLGITGLFHTLAATVYLVLAPNRGYIYVQSGPMNVLSGILVPNPGV